MKRTRYHHQSLHLQASDSAWGNNQHNTQLMLLIKEHFSNNNNNNNNWGIINTPHMYIAGKKVQITMPKTTPMHNLPSVKCFRHPRVSTQTLDAKAQGKKSARSGRRSTARAESFVVLRFQILLVIYLYEGVLRWWSSHRKKVGRWCSKIARSSHVWLFLSAGFPPILVAASVSWPLSFWVNSSPPYARVSLYRGR